MITKPTSNYDREAWLTEAAYLIREELISPALPAGHVTPHPFRVSVGYPPRSRVNTQTIGFCINADASADQHNEIFITPALDDSLRILDVLTHELIHQADNNKSGHRNFFAKVARRVGLEGKFTATHAGKGLTEYLNTIITLLGDIPHAAVNLAQAKKPQATRMLKLYCPQCGFNVRATKSNIQLIQDFTCPACASTDLVTLTNHN